MCCRRVHSIFRIEADGRSAVFHSELWINSFEMLTDRGRTDSEDLSDLEHVNDSSNLVISWVQSEECIDWKSS